VSQSDCRPRWRVLQPTVPHVIVGDLLALTAAKYLKKGGLDRSLLTLSEAIQLSASAYLE